MKRIFIFLILASNLAFGQSDKSYKENLNKSFNEYNDLILKQEFAKSMDYLIPEFFKILPKDKRVLEMKKIYNDPDVEIKTEKPKDIEYGKPKSIKGKYYSEITYSQNIKMRFKNFQKSENEEENKFNRNQMKLLLEESFGFGSGNVTFNEKTEFYEIHSSKKAFGVSENGTSDWKFVVGSNLYKKFDMGSLLPKELTENLSNN